jgi:16S rRNA processing protein RimM
VSTAHDPDAPELVLVGRVRRAHGIKGELVVEPLTDAPDATFASGRRLFAGTVDGDPAPDGRTLTIAQTRPFKEGWLIRFAEISDRNAAELWRQRYLLAPLDELDPPSEGEVYVHELPGLDVVLVGGERVGEIVGTYELPQGLALEVRLASRPDADTILIPFSEEVVREVSVEDGRVVIDPPVGLLE